MTAHEERQLVLIYKASPDSTEGQRAFEQLDEAHAKMVRQLAERHARRRGLKPFELEAAGHEALWRALEKFDLERDVRLMHYARPYVDGAIRTAAGELARPWHVSKGDKAKAVSKDRARRQLQCEGIEQPTRAAIADRIGVCDEELDYRDGALSYPQSFEAAGLTAKGDADENGDAEALSLADTTTATDEASAWHIKPLTPEEWVERAEALRHVGELVGLLDDQERYVVAAIYGADATEKATGQQMEPPISQQAISKIRRRALWKMKVEAEARGWAPTGYKGFTRTEDAIRAFMKARVETVRRSLLTITEHDIINYFAEGEAA